MNAREKTLALSVGGIVGAFALFFGVRAVFLKPIREVDLRISGVREKLDKLAADRRAYFSAEEAVKAAAARTFADDLDESSARSGETLTRIIINSGLREADFARLPVGPRKLRGAQEIGWSIRGDGPLANVINLLFLLDRLPAVHRIDGLVVSAGDAPGQVRVSFRYLTLIVSPMPEVERVELDSKFTAESPERRAYDPLVTRDLLRPYIRRPPPAPPGPHPAPAPAPVPPAAPGPESFRIVSLSDWGGQPEIHVRDLTAQKTARYKPGDSLAGGVIVMIDYRPLPLPGNESLQSFSRVILRVGNEYWAIERGRTLADRYKLKPELLPPNLSKL